MLLQIIDSPINKLMLVTTNDHLMRVVFEAEGFDTVLADLENQHGLPASPSKTELAAALQLQQYFAGQRRTFDLRLQQSCSTQFRLATHEALNQIPYGQTISYKQLAERLGSAGSARAVGAGCATNPLPIVQPCHRVVRSDGGLGGYRGGLAAKKFLLDLEKRHG